MKELAKEVGKMNRDKPKLYGLIRQHMSVESRDEVSQQPNYAVWHMEKDPEQLWQAIVGTHKVDCVSNVTEVMTLAARKAYQNIKQGASEGLSLYSERFHETYRAYKAMDSTSNPVDVKEEVQAMDFFHGLDNGRYGAFKTSMLNGWATKAVKPPKTANEIYRLAGSWVKQPTCTDGGGYAATYMTIEEEVKIRAKEANPKKPGKDKVNTPKKPAEKPGEEPKKEAKDLSHYSTSKERPLHPKNQAKSNEATGFANATWQEEQEASIFLSIVDDETEEVQEYEVNNAVQQQGVELTEVLLDNAANISMMHPSLLSDIRQAERKIKVKGIGSIQMIVDKVGTLEGFFEVYASESTKANVLSFAAVEDLYEISYVRGEAFVVHMDGRDLVFRRRDRLYVAEWIRDGGMYATVQENELLYTKEQVHRAKEAYEFIHNCGYPSTVEAQRLLKDGNVKGIPLLMSGDIERAYRIYGQHPEYVKGKLVKKTMGRVPIDMALQSIEKEQKLHTDMMSVDGAKYLVTVSDPLNLTMQTWIRNEGKTEMGMALQGQLGLLRSRAFKPVIVYADPHSTFRSMMYDFPGVEVDVGRASDYVPKVDAKICRIKELYRTVRSGLAWRLPGSLVPDLLAYTVARLNIHRTSAVTEAVAPKVAFTGIPVHYHKDVRLAFGDYVEAYEGTTNTSRPRSSACIALYPANNAAGSWQLFKIDTHTRVRRSNMVKLVTGELIIQAMNNIANKEEQSALEPVLQRLGEIAEEQQSASMQEVEIQETDEVPRGV